MKIKRKEEEKQKRRKREKKKRKRKMSTKELNAKIVLLGEATVGKTCTAVKYVKDTYIECPPTVVASYSSKKM